MSVERPVHARDEVVMDECHIELIRALVMCHKPRTVLEIGVGSGATTIAILDAISLNRRGSLTCVDNFFDWSGNKPDGFQKVEGRVRFILKDEKTFVEECTEKFDLVVSDADHEHTGDWFLSTLGLVSSGGFLIYHDSENPDWPSVRAAVCRAKSIGLTVMSFNKSSLPIERCERGLAVIKNEMRQ